MRVKVKIQYEGSTIDYEMNREADINSIIEILCLTIGVKGNKSEYVLQMDSTKEYLSSNLLSNLSYPIPSGSLINLKISPFISAKKVVESLRDPKRNKVVVFELQKSSLKDKEFSEYFLKEGGLSELIKFVSENQGSPLSVGLKAMYTALTYKIGWDTITDEFLIRVILPLIKSNNINVCKSSLDVAALLASSDTIGFTRVDRCMKACFGPNGSYAPVFESLNSTDVNVQCSSLYFINSLLNTCPNEQLKEFESGLEELGLSNHLKKLTQKTLQDENIKLQLYIYQALMLRRLLRLKESSYDKSNEKHEALLLKLWDLTFPDDPLTERVSEQWKLMGFQGNDPATDFRGMGLLGLQNLVYFAETYPDKWKDIVKRNLERKEREYPTAVAGINITQSLFDMLNVGKPINFQGPPLKIFKVLFDSPCSFEEMYCSTFEVLDRTWDEMNASYMDFSKVIAAVKKQIEASLEINSPSLKSFLGSSQESFASNHVVVEEDDSNDHPKLKEIKMEARKEAFSIVYQQKLNYLTEGCTFLNALKHKEKKGQYLFVQLDKQYQTLSFATVNQFTETTTSFIGSISKMDIKGISSGQAYINEVLKTRKIDISLLKRAFKIQTTSGTDLELIAQSESEFYNWSDGLRLWIGLPAQEKEIIDEINYLADLMRQVRTLDFSGIDIPENPPDIPPLPADYNFAISEEHVEVEQH